MATLEENYHFWNERFHWNHRAGEEWSSLWGGPQAQWQWCIYPRIRRHLPAPTILEIGPGYGRWTHFLRQHCQKLIVVDISERCIEACRERFGEQNMKYQVNDGTSLDFLEDNSVDFLFSFESLIHTELPDLCTYLLQLGRKLKNNGSAFLHHSNLGSYVGYFKALQRCPRALRRHLQSRGLLEHDNWRAESVTFSNFQEAAREANLSVLSQELIPWGGKRFTDCFSTLTVGLTDTPTTIVENPNFITRAREIRRLSWAYRQEGYMME